MFWVNYLVKIRFVLDETFRYTETRTNVAGTNIAWSNVAMTITNTEDLTNQLHTGYSLGTDICNVPFNFYLILILASFLLSLSSIYREGLLLSGKTCIKLNHNCANARTFY